MGEPQSTRMLGSCQPISLQPNYQRMALGLDLACSCTGHIYDQPFALSNMPYRYNLLWETYLAQQLHGPLYGVQRLHVNNWTPATRAFILLEFESNLSCMVIDILEAF